MFKTNKHTTNIKYIIYKQKDTYVKNNDLSRYRFNVLELAQG